MISPKIRVNRILVPCNIALRCPVTFFHSSCPDSFHKGMPNIGQINHCCLDTTLISTILQKLFAAIIEYLCHSRGWPDNTGSAHKPRCQITTAQVGRRDKHIIIHSSTTVPSSKCCCYGSRSNSAKKHQPKAFYQTAYQHDPIPGGNSTQSRTHNNRN